MDLAYWGFRHWPFDRSFAVDRFFASPQHEEALSRLLFLVEESRRCGIIVGPCGTGKTYLVKLVQQRAERLGRIVVRCDATGLDCEEIMASVAAGCHVLCDTKAKTWNGLRARFAALALIRQPVVLLIDHFEPLESGSVQAIRRLHQLADMVGLKLTIALAMREGLLPNELQELVDVQIDIAPWTVRETADFIRLAIHRAGGHAPLFTVEAIQAIHDSTQGVPAKIISLGNLCLLAATGAEEEFVTSEIAEAAAGELFPRIDHSSSKTGVHSNRSAETRFARSAMR